MDWKKLTFLDHFPYTLLPGSKMVSHFCWYLGVPLLVLTLIFFNKSSTNPLFFKTFSSYNSSSSSSSIVPWPLSFSSTGFTSTNTETHKPNASKILENSNSSDSGGFGDTHLLNFSVGAENGNFSKPISEQFFWGDANGSFVGKSVGFDGNSSSNGVLGSDNSTTTTAAGDNSTTTAVADAVEAGIAISGYGSELKKMGDGYKGECDIFVGRWVRDDSKPYYPVGSCPHIDKDFDCLLNGRPDDGFLRWKWQPNGCEIPSLNATDFLERLRGKKMVFVGDSLNRNMWESLVCILRHNIRNKKRVYEISGRTEFKKKGFYAFRFEDYNCTVDFVSSPFLVRESTYNGKNGSFETLRLDLMDHSTSMYHDADIIVFNTGHWWTHEKTSRGQDYYQEGDQVYPRLKVLEAYKKALATWSRWADENIDPSKTQVIFRGYSVTHFRGGPWNSGGQCHKETEPIFNDTYLRKYPSKMRALEPVLHEMKTPVIYLNISRLTDYRKDGHPSIYRKDYHSEEDKNALVHSQDCSHWCLPGVPDTWNELLYASLLKVVKN